jgi:redox-sensing transcriptional repressor
MDSTPGQGRWPDDPAIQTAKSSCNPGVEGNGELPTGDGGEISRGLRRIPEATVARLPVYLRCLMEVADARIATISSERLAEMAGVNAAKVRKDLSHLGSYGTRGVGYEVEYLLVQISRVLGLTQDCPVVIVGVGNLGQALANYRGFSARGFRIAALVDADPRKVGERVGDLLVRDIESLPEIVEPGCIGIIATPAAAAQDVADRLVAAGVTSILNFAPAVISVPKGISMRKVDLSIELQILSFYQQRRSGGPVRDGVPTGDGLPAGPEDVPRGDAQGATI